MKGKITFVGAGPGAPDLITLRGASVLSEADTVIYAGSLVNEKLLESAPRAKLRNSAALTLPEVIEIMERDFGAGKNVVRLHTGDPSMYGAVAEQFRELEKRGIPYEVVPGVSSVFAAAAALKIELTVPGVSQSVILTRDAGRTPVPDAEALEKLAAHGTTLCIFLSVGDMHALCRKLLDAGRSPQTPAAVVYRASWENQTVVRGTVSDIARRVEEAGIKRQALIVIGDVLGRDGELSRLYDAEFHTGFRHAGFQGKIALFALTRRAVLKAAEIASGLENAVVYLPEEFAGDVSALRARKFTGGGFQTALNDAWNRYDAFIFVMAAGIVVRLIGKLCRNKSGDPAVVVCDEAGNYTVSLLSGHVGGGNALARDVAGITGGKPVVTTASDVENLPAFDEFAKLHHYAILTPETLTAVAASVVNGGEISLEMPEELFRACFSGIPNFSLRKNRTDGIVEVHASGGSLKMRKLSFVLGIGCRKNVPAERIAEAVEAILKKYRFRREEIAVLATAELKKEEPGLLEFAKSIGKQIRFYSAGELNAVDVPHPSEAARKRLGIRSVSEAAALLAAGKNGRLYVGKQADADVTVAIAGGLPDE
ncbi:MAG: Cobalt-precorrin-4 C(11)-methyltransferase [Lentisphaerae bacterium ADurb.Bin242]|nr:MAG: Cobalt-precorrin-4 C(11)-methyltransferase [Lentisphaerae bacterium ADurb.Bin242]